MSRSHRKTPKAGTCVCRSEKDDKRFARRKLRRAIGRAVEAGLDVLPVKREVSDPWSMGKDGKSRFDPEKYPELMRK